MKGCCAAAKAKPLSATYAGAGVRAVLGGGRAEINFSNFFSSPSFHNTLLFRDSAPEECRLPWKPFLGPLVRGMSGLLSLERLWQGRSRECCGDGWHFCRIFIGQFILCLLCGAVRDQLVAPPGTGGTSRTWHRSIRAAFDTALGPAHIKEKAQAGQQNSVSPVCTGLTHEQLPAAHGSSRHFSW